MSHFNLVTFMSEFWKITWNERWTRDTSETKERTERAATESQPAYNSTE